ncbi:MAG TPA: hypothetical protein VGC19_03060 [Rhodanobacter sp.]
MRQGNGWPWHRPTRRLPVDDVHWLAYPVRSMEHPGLKAFRQWLLAEADDYCGHLPVPGTDDARPED